MHDDAHVALDLSKRSWTEVLPTLRERLAADGRVDVIVRDPGAGYGRWRGESDASGLSHLTLRDWLDLAESLGARVRTVRDEEAGGEPMLRLRLEALGPEANLHGGRRRPDDTAHDVRYGAESDFARVRKSALPGFRLPLQQAVAFASGADGEPFGSVLIVGCHRGDELEVLADAEPPTPPERIVGVDRHEPALAQARARFPDARFVRADLAQLTADEPLPLDGRFDLIVAIAVLQSSGLDGALVLRGLVRHHAAESGGLIVGLPASRFRDGEIVWGARTRNYAETDLSLVVRDLAGHRRYLHQHGYRTRIGGRYDLLLAARR